MKKMKVFILLTLSMILMGSVCAFAYTNDTSGKWRGQLYNVKFVGSKGTMNAVGTVVSGKNVAYTVMKNDTTSTQYMYVEVCQFTHGGTGFNVPLTFTGYVNAGRQADTGNMSRNKTSDILDYYHYGKVYVSQGAGAYYDYIKYVAKQYYE